MRPHFSPTYRVPSGTSRAKSEVVFSDLFRRKLRDGRSRKDRAERGRHHAKGTCIKNLLDSCGMLRVHTICSIFPWCVLKDW